MTTLREAAEIALAALSHPNFQGAEEAETILRDALGKSKSSSKLRETLAQPEQGPLPVEEIIKIWNDMGNDPIAPSVFSFIACVRKTEQAHGIGGEE